MQCVVARGTNTDRNAPGARQVPFTAATLPFMLNDEAVGQFEVLSWISYSRQ